MIGAPVEIPFERILLEAINVGVTMTTFLQFFVLCSLL